MEDCGKALTELILSGGKASLRRVICVRLPRVIDLRGKSIPVTQNRKCTGDATQAQPKFKDQRTSPRAESGGAGGARTEEMTSERGHASLAEIGSQTRELLMPFYSE